MVSDSTQVDAIAALESIIADKRKSSDEPPVAAKPIGDVRRPKFTPMTPEQAKAADEQFARDIRDKKRKRYEANANALKDAAGRRYAACTLDNYKVSCDMQARIVNALREYVESNAVDNGEGIVMYGPVGTGKDHLLFAVASQCVAIDFRVQWVNGQDLFGEIRDRMDGDKPESAFFDKYAGSQLLVLSDPLPPFGNLTQHQATMLYRLMDDRASRRLPTFVSVNVADDAEADARIGAATWDRMCDGAWKIRCAWPSYRKPVKDIH